MQSERRHPDTPAFDARAFAGAVSAYAREWDLFPPGSRVLVMVSGGQDSVTLLHLLAGGSLGPGPGAVHALHVNHRLRGAASEADQQLVEELCGALGVGLTVRAAPVSKREGNLQEVARDARRAAADAVAADVGATCVALGHTLDDQSETILYRLARYGGLAALAGMRPRDGSLVRPLLARRRSETRSYCETLGLAFARDAGNDDPSYRRTALRSEVVPAWEGAVPGALRALGRAAETAAEALDAQMALVESIAGFVCPGGGEVARPVPAEVSVARLRGVPGPLRRAFLHRWLAFHGEPSCARATVLAVEDLTGRPGSGVVALAGGACVIKEYDRMRIVAGSSGVDAHAGRPSGSAGPMGTVEASAPEDEELLSVPGMATWRELTLSAETVARMRAHDPRLEAYLDARAIDRPLVVRGARPGDRLRPLGSPGHRLVQDILLDARVPRRLRSRVPLVLSGDRVLWVVGIAVAEEGRIRPDTARVVRLAVAPAEGGGAPGTA